MNEAEMLSLADQCVEEYLDLLHIDPYFKVKIECTDAVKVSDCCESGTPATWRLRLNPSSHMDAIDVQISVLNAALSILFRDIPQSSRLDEVRSKLTHTLMRLTASDAEDTAQTADD